jgi:hypothetical protein
LVGFGAHNAAAVAATLLYRSLTFVPSVVLGLAAAATYNLSKPRLTAATARSAAGEGAGRAPIR